jgi:glucokinase
MILAADVGATNTRLGLFELSNGKLQAKLVRRFRNRDYPGLEASLNEFLNSGNRVDSACFGLAGPVIDGRVELTNCGWVVDQSKLMTQLGTTRVCLLNDMEATGYGVVNVGEQDLLVLNKGVPDDTASAALIAAGTGLGETVLRGNSSSRVPLPGEAGHADFAPNNEAETELLRYLRERFHHVSWDRVLSGPGLLLIYEFFRDTGRGTEQPAIAEQVRTGEAGAVISAAAVAGTCELCSQALDLFVGIYGAETGNLALRALARGGVYIAGGIAPKIRQKIQEGSFMRAFFDKGRMRPLVESIPVYLILSEQTALLGAAAFAAANFSLESATTSTR